MNIVIGIDSLRLANDGGELPNARKVFERVVGIDGHTDPYNITLAVMSFGQFITHDIAHSEDYTYGTTGLIFKIKPSILHF